MSWDIIVGQQRAKKILQSAIEQDRLAHAYLFAGPEGAGKSACAVELAKVLNCVRKGSEACDACPSCRKFASLQHPNLLLLFALPAAPSDRMSDDDVAAVREEIARKAADPYHVIAVPRGTAIRISSIREVRRSASLALAQPGRRVVVFLEADLMTDEAANALLKLLEEPQPDTMLVLTTARPDRLLPTIVSRCQKITFEPVSDDAVAAALAGRDGVESEEALVIARAAQGSYGRARGLVGGNLPERRRRAVEFLRCALTKSDADVAAEVEALAGENDRREIAEMLSLLQLWLRDAMYHAADPSYRSGMGDDDSLRRFVSRIPDGDVDGPVGALDRAILHLGKNAYIPLVLLSLALELRRLCSQNN